MPSSTTRRVLSTAIALSALVATAQPASAAVLPGMSAAFSVAASAHNKPRNLVFTLTNSDIPSTFTFSFTLTLPTGTMPLGGETSTCTDTTISDTPPTDPGGGIPGGRAALVADVRYVDGTMTSPTSTCTVTIPLTASDEGVYTTCSGDLADLAGLTPPATCASIYFAEPYAS
ncbi:hypothetical protein [Actinokineospora terrae]|uniref:DUF7933 domain-containing protein n=1 Tax=Actinokineospora terrae TaxID=155974 RepID=A0A1H9TV86_9PSEU|nr:hypothetical protein [Actinokineospora terrae]SES00908.1 hypothetical protein SAMN04487818_106489 [Actinokineospora terrae]